MVQELKAQANYDSNHEKKDAIELLKMIQRICFNYQTELFPPLVTIRSLIAVCTATQPDNMSNTDWQDHLLNLVTATEAFGDNLP